MHGPRVVLGATVAALALACGGRSAEDGRTMMSGPADVAHCSNLADDSAPAITVVIENQTSQPLYVGPERTGCEPTLNSLFSVATESGAVVVSGRACGNVACSELGSGHFGGFACPNICLSGGDYSQLMPGESHSTQWSPAQLVSYELPDKCLGKSTALLRQCTRVEPLPAGTSLRFEARASATVACQGFAACGACNADAAGGCTVRATELGGQVLSAASSLVVGQEHLAGAPDALPVRLVFLQ